MPTVAAAQGQAQGQSTFLSPLMAFVKPQRGLDDNPLDIPVLRYFALLALVLVLLGLVPDKPSLIPAFISTADADVVARRRRAKIELQRGREARYGDEGFRRQRGRVRKLVMLAMVEMVGWSLRAGWERDWLRAGLTAVAWFVILTTLLLRPPLTPPFWILASLLVLLIRGFADILEYLPAVVSSPLVVRWGLVGHVMDAVLTGISMALILSMPMTPGGWEATVDQDERDRILQGTVVEEKEDMADNYHLCPTTPEDYTSLFSTLTYRWMNPIQKLALQRPLLPSDLWRLRYINDTRILYSKFRALASVRPDGSKRGLATRIIRANARDVALDAFYKVCGVTLAYAGPALMRQILEAIGEAAAVDQNANSQALALVEEKARWTPRERAFVYALITLLLTLIRYVAELLNFHHARQVGLRIRSVMVAELFEKALKRRNLAGVVALPSVSADEATKVKAATREKAAASAAKASRKAETAERIDGGETLDEAAEEAEEAVKSQRVTPSLDSDSTTPSADIGKVVNMMSSDVNVLLRMGCDLHQLYGAPAEVIIATVFLYRLLGWPALVGFSLLVLALPINYVQGRYSVAASRHWKHMVDSRMGLVTELLGAARFIKLQGVASQWRDRVLDARAKEIAALLRVRFAELGFTIIFSALPIGVTLVSFFCYVKIQGNELTVPTAFTAVTLFSMVRTPLGVVPAFAMATLNALVSIKRLEAFLEEGEVDAFISALGERASSTLEDLDPPERTSIEVPQTDEPLEIKGGTFRWSSSTNGGKAALTDISISFPPGVLSLVAGPTGSGKSSLLHALLGELKQTAGSLHLPKWINDDAHDRQSGLSYASQAPWIEGGKSIKQNIVFNSAYDSDRYESVLHACALYDDLRLFDEGDETRVSGTTLSGGQQARIGLARALYAPSHTVFLDDPLAAVDAHVQRHLIDHAINGPICRGRRIILVTHHVGQVLRYAQYAVFLKSGAVDVQGRVEDLKTTGQLSKHLQESLNGESSPNASSSSSRASSSTERPAKTDSEPEDQQHPEPNGNGHAAEAKKPPRLLYELEGRREGAVQWSFYSVYLGASSPLMWAIIVGMTVGLRVAASSEQYWLKVWGEASGQPGQRSGLIGRLPPAEGHESFYLEIYGLIGLSIVVLGVVKTIIFWFATLQASQKLYVRLLTSVLSAKLRFFDVNPLGRILQRFNQDVSVMDTELPSSSVNFLNNSMALAGYLAICAVIVPWFLLPSALFFTLGPRYVKGFLASTRDMQRIVSTSTSPLYTSFATAMAGITTIRAFGAERARLDEMLTILDVTQAQWWAICTIEIWLQFRSQILGGLAIFTVSTLALTGAVSAGSAGMVMTSASLLTQLCFYLTNDWKHLSNNLNSIERIAEYFSLPSESDGARGSSNGQAQSQRMNQPPAAWPSNSGSIHIEELRLSYDSSLPDVLHDVSIDIGPCEKVGIVGRTGSGKTTLASALFRALEAKSGRIIIDGIDISTIDVDTLRQRICIVPQSPVLFSGTLRRNLDPFDERTDEECLWALRKVRVHATVSATASSSPSLLANGYDEEDNLEGEPVMRLSLDSPVAAGGANFSAGEAQLLSLARALLRDARVVVLDEATSSTDSETDGAIQRAVREMKESTVITVAHRLQTVLDYDRVLVLSAGRVLEYGPPSELLRRPEGHFRQMCAASGVHLSAISS